MKKKFYELGMLVMMLAMCFVFGGCDTGNGNDPGDTTAPVLSLQAVAEYEETELGTTAKVLFTSSKAGTCYVLVLPATDAVPAASVLAATGNTAAVTANTPAVVNITGLNEGSTYKAHVTVKDAAGNFSNVWSSASFTPSMRVGEVSNPFIGTWIQDKFGSDEEIKVIVTDTTWATYMTNSSQGLTNVPICSGTYTYAGMPAIWVVTATLGEPYTSLKIGDVGTALINLGTKILVSTFSDPGANGYYTKQQSPTAAHLNEKDWVCTGGGMPIGVAFITMTFSGTNQWLETMHGGSRDGKTITGTYTVSGLTITFTITAGGTLDDPEAAPGTIYTGIFDAALAATITIPGADIVLVRKESAWTKVDLYNIFGITPIDVVEYGGGTWVAASEGGKMATSTNGITWTARDASSIFGSSSITALSYGNGRWMAVGGFWTTGADSVNNHGKMATSTDGVVWIEVNVSDIFSSIINAVAYGGDTWVAAGYDNKLATSPDGIVWTEQDVFSIFNNSTHANKGIDTVVYGDGTWVAAGPGRKLATSPDGIAWTQRDISNVYYSEYTTIISMVYGGGKWVAFGSSKLMVSTNGASWTEVDISNLYDTFFPFILAYGGGVFLGSENFFTGKIVSSTDGENWTKLDGSWMFTPMPGAPGHSEYFGMLDVAYGNGKWIAAGYQANTRDLVPAGLRGTIVYIDEDDL